MQSWPAQLLGTCQALGFQSPELVQGATLLGFHHCHDGDLQGQMGAQVVVALAPSHIPPRVHPGNGTQPQLPLSFKAPPRALTGRVKGTSRPRQKPPA